MYSREAYEHLLNVLREQGYCYRLFTEPTEDEQKVVYLRHDIDYSPEIALEFAQINHRAGARATFFFQLRSKIYNLLAHPTLEIVEKIQALGQKIGLHYVLPPDWRKTRHLLRQRILSDFEVMKTAVPRLNLVFAWHNPSSTPGWIEENLDLNVPWLVNAYNRYFFTEVKYISDSDLRYTIEEFENIITHGHQKLHLLFHPFQWICGGPDMVKVISLTWPHIIREREKGVLENRVYRQTYPDGMPVEIIDHFAEALSRINHAMAGNAVENAPTARVSESFEPRQAL